MSADLDGRIGGNSTQQVAVVRREGELAVVALKPFAIGDEVMQIEGPVVAQPSRYSVQIGEHAHVDVSWEADRDAPGRHSWLFLNHACDPSAVLRGRHLVARRAIAVGGDVTFDYATTEWDMATPFVCHCGSSQCRGRVLGYRHLTDEQRAALPEVAAHLRQRMAPERRVASMRGSA